MPQLYVSKGVKENPCSLIGRKYLTGNKVIGLVIGLLSCLLFIFI